MALLALLDRISLAAAWIGALLFALIGLFVTYEVVMRYVFVAPTMWVEEVSRVMQLYAVFLGVAWLVARRQHIRVRVITSRLPRAGRLWCGRLALIVAAGFGAIAAWYGVELMQFSIAMGEVTDTSLALPMWLVLLPVPGGSALVAVHAAAMVAASFRDPEIVLAHEMPAIAADGV